MKFKNMFPAKVETVAIKAPPDTAAAEAKLISSSLNGP